MDSMATRKPAPSLSGAEAGQEEEALPAPLRSAFRDADRVIHAGLGALTFGISPVSLFQAWQDWAVNLAISPGKQSAIALKAVEKWNRLALHLASCAAGGEARPCISPLPQDRRFSDPAWHSPPFSILQQSFLLAQQWWHNATTEVPGVSRRHEQLVEFYCRQVLDTVSPSNFALTNPEVLQKTIDSGGANFADGYANLVADMMELAGLSETGEEGQFRPGHEVALTPGDVVFRNDMIELIRYRPRQKGRHAQPVLIVPAWIMKYYILDLSPHNSLIGYLVDQGHEVFCISWRNPGPRHRDWSLDDYRRNGFMAALDIASAGGRWKVHATGYCLGGTLLAMAAAAMARDGDHRLQSVSLFASLVDFDEPGEIGLFIDEGQVAMIEDMMWSLGYLDQRQMAGAFQTLRSRDLLWSRLVRDYLMGERAAPTDLMAWNADATRMPYRMHNDYLRRLYLGNDLALGRYRVDGRPVHLESISAPVFAVATASDHVAPWRSVFKLTHILDTDVDFVLTNGGHNAGIISEPGHVGRTYRKLAHRYGTGHPDPDEWSVTASEMAGSWWPEWTRWLETHSAAPEGKGRKPPSYPSLGPAPGTYVLER